MSFEVREDRAGIPKRQSLPILLFGAIALWASTALSYMFMQNADASACLTMFLASSLFLLCSVLSFVFLKAGRFSIVVLFIGIGVLLGISGGLSVHKAQIESTEDEHQWSIELLQDMSYSDFSSYATAYATNELGQKFKISVRDYDQGSYLCKDRFVGKVTLSALKETQLDSAWQQGVCASIDITKLEHVEPRYPFNFMVDIRKEALDSINIYAGESSGILDALICGNRFLIQKDGTYEKYKTCGLAHIIAVSGAHLAIVAMVLSWFLRLFRLPRIASTVTCSLFLFVYLVFAGMPISAIRATIMVIISYTSWMFARRSASLNACAICIIAFMVSDSTSSLSVSLFLSAGSTIGIIVFSSLISSWFAFRNKNLRKFISEPISLTLASNVVTQPFSAALFSQLPLISILANIVVTPFFTLGCVLGVVLVMVSLLVFPLREICIIAASFSVFPLQICVELLSRIPYASIPTSVDIVFMLFLTAVLCVFLWLGWDRIDLKKLLLFGAPVLLVTLLLAVFNPSRNLDEVIMLDVGQGDSFLVRSRGVQVLIDTGNMDSRLREELGKYAVYDLDAVVITHPDDDHCGSLSSLSGYVNIDSVLISSVVLDCDCEKCLRFKDDASKIRCSGGVSCISPGQSIEVGAFTIKVLWPWENTDDGGNGDSLVMLMESDCNLDGVVEWRTLFTGDAEKDEIEPICDKGYLGDIDILKVGHHGSKVSLDDELAKTLDPEISLISVGSNNRYGHPSTNVLELLEVQESNIFRTDQEGCVELKYNPNKIEICTNNGRKLSLIGEGCEDIENG